MIDLLDNQIHEKINDKYEEKKNEHKIIKITSEFAKILVGIIFIIFSHNLVNHVHLIIGTGTIILSTISLILNIIDKEYKTLETKKIPMNIVSIIVGIMIILEQSNAIPLIAIIWGITGLRKGTKELNVAIYNKINKKPFILELLHAIFETTLSLLLIFDPFEKFAEHIIILGLQIILTALKDNFKDIEFSNIDD